MGEISRNRPQWCLDHFRLRPGAIARKGAVHHGEKPRLASTLEAWANWYDSAGPAAAAVNVDGICHPMSLQRGTATNGAWMAEVTGVETGCHRYYFEFQDSAGNVVTYPTTGSLAIGSGAGCPDWDATRPGSCLVAGDQIFADGFESAGLSRWSSVVSSP